MPVRFKGGGGGGGADVPSVLFDEGVNVEDHLTTGFITPEEVSVDDSLGLLGFATPENVNVDDALSVPLLLPAYQEGPQVNDLTKWVINSIDVPRSGTPATDFLRDAYTDQASPATNFGNVSPLLVKRSAGVGNNERRAYMAFDMRQFAGFTPFHGPHVDDRGFNVSVLFEFVASSTSVVGQSVGVTMRVVGSNPFDEATVTWNNPPTLGNQTFSSEAYTITTTPTRFFLGLSTTELAEAPGVLGNWLLVVFQITSVIDTGIDVTSVVGRESSVVANRPKLTIDYIQRGT